MSNKTIGTLWLLVSSLLVYVLLMGRQTAIFEQMEELDKERSISISPETRAKITLGTQSCQPVENIVYVKTHKTASSALRRILARSIPFKIRSFPNPYFGGYPAPFQRRFLSVQKKYNSGEFQTVYSLGGHFRYNATEIKATVRGKCKYITILRNPFRQFESSFYFYYGRFSTFFEGLNKVSCMGEPYLQVTGRMGVNITSYLEAASSSLNDSMAWFFRSRNYQSFDLGMDPKLGKTSAIRKYVKKLDETFDLVLISDYYLESLILLKDALCMEWSDITPKLINEGHYEKHKFTAREIGLLRELNKQDFVLFEHFNRTFWKKINAYGASRMRRDVETLRSEAARYRSNEQKHDDKADTSERTRPRAKRKVVGPLAHVTRKTRKEHIEQLKTRIFQQCGAYEMCRRENVVHEIAEVMVDNNGWCPH